VLVAHPTDPDGPGNLNASRCMDRAIALARKRGLGYVALANTNHWMRGGT
jgi:3-dehydro-L-gulonate 2-dehydrogenase